MRPPGGTEPELDAEACETGGRTLASRRARLSVPVSGGGSDVLRATLPCLADDASSFGGCVLLRLPLPSESGPLRLDTRASGTPSSETSLPASQRQEAFMSEAWR